MEKISVLLPTRQRAVWLTRLADSILETANHPENIELVTYIDEDDGSYDELKSIKLDWIQVRGPREHDGIANLSVMWNRCYNEATGDILMHCGDDIVFRTEGWDDVVRAAFRQQADHILFVYGSDGNGESEKNKFGTHGFIHRDWVNAVGYFVPPYFASDYNDTFLNDIAKQVNRHQYVDILTEHLHFSVGKAEIDTNTRERLARHAAQHPEVIYESHEFRLEMADAAEKLRQVIEGAV